MLLGGACLGIVGLVTGYLLYPRGAPVASADLKAAMNELVQDFQRTHDARAFVSLGALAAFGVSSELADPAWHLPHPFRYPYRDLAQAYRYARGCGTPPRVDDPRSQKLVRWLAYTCGHRDLPADFLAQPPYLHPSGASYAALLASRRPAAGRGGEAAAPVKRFLHVLELSQLPDGLSPDEQIWAQIPPGQLEAVYNKAPAALGPAYLLVRAADRSADERAALTYAVYPRSDWQAFLDRSYVSASEAMTGRPPAAKVGNMAVEVNAVKIARRRTLALGLAFGAASLLALGSLGISAGFYRMRRAEVRRRLFNLRMLSHELRTPATALKLNLEPLREAYDVLPPKLQVALMNTLAAEGQLGKVLDASLLYLHANAKGRAPELRMEPCPSLNEFIDDVVSGFPAAVERLPPAVDVAAVIDRYWLNFCVANVIDNALKHGRPPVRVAWGRVAERIFVSVEDQGTFSAADQAAARRPFARRSARSDGLGLGLSLVYDMAAELGGGVEFTASPTTFKLWFRG